ncbi:hypothetical protein [Burkholderia sp. Ax-1724]|uniref:hypothetical protein n=1 Tax=Burkholderia sp. Ax-1724 TaxID=2608336 RepID=UPI00141DAD7D|nr:hypothetical protein [Burkholderia sp. Ax-1724]NIF52160.1 hypothetical protein [Burkholderia sp. Ax-1724]
MLSSHLFWFVAISFVAVALASSGAPELTDRMFLLAPMPLRHAWRLADALAATACPLARATSTATPRIARAPGKPNPLDLSRKRFAAALAHPFEIATRAADVETKSQADQPPSTTRNASNTCNAMPGVLPGQPVNAGDFGAMLRGRTMAA